MQTEYRNKKVLVVVVVVVVVSNNHTSEKSYDICLKHEPVLIENRK